MSAFPEHYQTLKSLVEQALSASLPESAGEWPEEGIPRHLAEAMRYSLLAGGKRLRPVLLLAAYQTIFDDLVPALPFACALEMIHTYSLIHDDLPAMDDDDMRRGRPTNHKVYGEAMAILAGDALLTQAFAMMADSSLPGAVCAIGLIARLAGPSGMIAGQVADIGFESKRPEPWMVRYIHERKTAALLTAPIVAGLVLCGADSDTKDAGTRYGRALGLAFQITDDLLDLQGDPALTGKAGHRDQALGKITWPAVVGVEQAVQDARAAVQSAVDAASRLGRNAAFFKALARSIPERVQ